MNGKIDENQLKEILDYGFQKGNNQSEISVIELIQELSTKLIPLVKKEEKE